MGHCLVLAVCFESNKCCSCDWKTNTFLLKLTLKLNCSLLIYGSQNFYKRPNMHSLESMWILTAFHKVLACIHGVNIQNVLTLLQGPSTYWELWKKSICILKYFLFWGSTEEIRYFHDINVSFAVVCNPAIPSSTFRRFFLSSLMTSVNNLENIYMHL